MYNYIFLFSLLLFLILIAWIIFSSSPKTKLKTRSMKVFLAIILGHVLLSSGYFAKEHFRWNAYEDCQSKYDITGINIHEKCRKYVNIADGAANIFYLLFAWILAIGYCGICELFWRIYYRKEVRNMGRDFKGKLLSNIFIIISSPIWLYMIVLVVTGVYILIYPYKQ